MLNAALRLWRSAPTADVSSATVNADGAAESRHFIANCVVKPIVADSFISARRLAFREYLLVTIHSSGHQPFFQIGVSPRLFKAGRL